MIGETTEDTQGMPRQDAETLQVRSPLPSEPLKVPGSHTAPYSWTSISERQTFTLKLYALYSLSVPAP